MEENDFTLARVRSRWYLAQTITEMNYAEDIALLANTPTQDESLLLRLEKAAGGIGLHADKTEYMSFNQDLKGDISTLKGGSLKLVNKFTYLGSSVSSTENYINTQLAKTWATLCRLSVIWKKELSYKIKRDFFPGNSHVYTIICVHHMDADQVYREKAWRQFHKNAVSYNEQI